jgi:xylulokinase
MENTRADMFHAVMEGVALNLNVILSIFKKYVPIEDMALIGGGGKGALWRRIMADIYGLPVKRLKYLEEATSIGAAVTGGVGVGALKGFDCVGEFNEAVETTLPDAKNKETYEELMRTFDAVYYALEPLFGMMK